MIGYKQLVGELDQQIEGVLTRQVLDAESAYCGGFMDGDRLVSSQSISAVARLATPICWPSRATTAAKSFCRGSFSLLSLPAGIGIRRAALIY